MNSFFQITDSTDQKIDLLQDHSLNRILWGVLAFQAGWANVGGFLACHRFVTHVTGFATQFGYDVALMRLRDALGMITVPIFFLAGSIISGFYVDNLSDSGKKNILFFLMSAFYFLVSVFGIMGAFGAFGQELDIVASYTLIALLCLASGIQNAATSSLTQNFVRTTHLTGTTTDLGLGLVRAFKKDNPEISNREKQQNTVRIILILSFIFGSLCSSFIFLKIQYYGFFIPSFISLFIFILLKRRVALHD